MPLWLSLLGAGAGRGAVLGSCPNHPFPRSANSWSRKCGFTSLETHPMPLWLERSADSEGIQADEARRVQRSSCSHVWLGVGKPTHEAERCP